VNTGRILLGIGLALLLIIVVAGVGWYGYNMGIAQTAIQNGQIAPAPNGVAPFVRPYGFGFYRPFGFGFGFLGCLIPLLFILLIFGLLRFLFWGPRWGRGWGRGWGYGPYGWDPSRGDIPPPLKDLHRRLHESESNPPPTSAPGAPSGS